MTNRSGITAKLFFHWNWMMTKTFDEMEFFIGVKRFQGQVNSCHNSGDLANMYNVLLAPGVFIKLAEPNCLNKPGAQFG